jgi:hypothetical protein
MLWLDAWNDDRSMGKAKQATREYYFLAVAIFNYTKHKGIFSFELLPNLAENRWVLFTLITILICT